MSTEILPFDPVDCSLDGLTLVEASAGTGKTWSIATLVVRLVLQAGLRADQLLVVTFTRAAARELRDRVRARLREALDACQPGAEASDAQLERIVTPFRAREDAVGRLASALRDLDQAVITTIHSFCQRALSRWAFESGGRFGLSLDGDQAEAREDLAYDWWVRLRTRADPMELAALDATSLATFDKVLEEAGRFHDLQVLPPAEELPCLTDVAEDVARARDAIVTLWAQQDCREAAIAVLEKTGVVNAHSLRQRTRQDLYQALDQLGELDPATGTLQDIWATKYWSGFDRAHDGKMIRRLDLVLADPVWAALATLRASLDARSHAQQRWVTQQLVALAQQGAPALRMARRARGVLDFGDLILELDAALQSARGAELARVIRTELPCALIDEFQDTDRSQYRIFQRIYLDTQGAGSTRTQDGSRLFLVGDPKQAIYAFRGADIQGYLEAAKDASSMRRTMRRNWRSDGDLVKALGHLFGRVTRPFGYDEIDYVNVDAAAAARRGSFPRDGAAPLQLRFAEHIPKNGRETAHTKDWLRETAYDAVAAEIVRLLDGQSHIPDGRGAQRPVRPRDIAVLCGWSVDLWAMQQALRGRGVRAVLLSDEDVWASPQAAALITLLRAVMESDREALVRTALAGAILGRTAAEIVAITEQERVPEGVALPFFSTWDDGVNTLRAFRGAWEDHGLLRAFRSLLATGDVLERLLAGPEGERALTNLQHIVELLHELSVREHLGVAGLLARLERNREQSKDRTQAEDAMLRLESDEDAVILSTIHRAKGLEYPVVFLPSLWTKTHAPRGGEPVIFYDKGRMSMDLGSPDLQEHGMAAMEKSWTEQMRLLYVALTRARHRAVVLWGSTRDMESSAMAALLHGPGTQQPLNLDAVMERVKSATDSLITADLDALEAEAEGSIAWSKLDLSAGDHFDRSVQAGMDPVPRTFTHQVPALWRTSSYSSLVRRAHDAAAEVERMGGTDEEDVDILPGQGDQDEPCLLLSLPKGAQTGTAIHEVLEHVDFQLAVGQDGPTTHLVDQVKQRLAEHRVGDASQAQSVALELQRVLRTELSNGVRLADLRGSDRLNELSFLLPVGPTLSPGRLADALAVGSDGDPLMQQAADRVGKLGFMSLQGYLTGFIDLLFRHDGRFHVVDYKTNHLGDTLGAYAPAHLGHAMLHANYLLQLHLYVVATHRFLQGRVPGYAYQTHMGPAMYLFLRGMTPKTGPALGTFRVDVPQARVDALDRLFAPPAMEGA
ncbi:MAG: exodeoxyribonuclease V subunit beta [Oligoflexia bacterium]|nr:exodeoxyribonuclease V subunit beta [Oligoflexia bacterium]